jgi:hypothetical protein
MTINIQCYPTPVMWLETEPPLLVPVLAGEQGEILLGEGGEVLGPEE